MYSAGAKSFSRLQIQKIVLSHNHNDSFARGGITCGYEAGALAMEDVQHYRAMGSLCRQLAVFDRIHSWKYLIEAQKWEHRAEAAITSHFKECNTAGSSELARSATTPGTNDRRLTTNAEASRPREM
jgi:hypothetical protein